MSAYVLTPLAKAGIFDIWGYSAENSESAADRVAVLDVEPLPAYTIVYRPTRSHFKSLPFCTASETSVAFSTSVGKRGRPANKLKASEMGFLKRSQ